jgi:DNA-binding Lrp family transcriptional regulator
MLLSSRNKIVILDYIALLSLWYCMNGVISYMLLVTDTGKEYDVIRDVKGIRGVTETRSVYGEFDVFVRMEVGDLALMDEIVTQVRRIPGVLKTTTLVASP